MADATKPPSSPLVPSGSNNSHPPPPRITIHTPNSSSPVPELGDFQPKNSRARHRHPNYPFGHHHNSSISSLSQLNSPVPQPPGSSSNTTSPATAPNPPPHFINTALHVAPADLNKLPFQDDSRRSAPFAAACTFLKLKLAHFVLSPHSHVVSPHSWVLIILFLFGTCVLLVVKPWHTRPPAGYYPTPSTHVPGDYFPDLNRSTRTQYPSHLSITDNVIYPHHSAVDAEWGYIDREPGNFERLVIGSPSPRLPTLPRKLGIIAIPAGEKAKPLVDRLVRRFGTHHFSFMIFHWDNATWHDFSWYKDVIGVRSMAQTKFWFAKRFLTPDVVQNYDYVWLWDDDIEPEPSFDPVKFINTLKKFHIHFAQPSLTWGEHGLQGPVVKKRDGVKIGRFTTFIEVMMPVISRGAWPCAWRMIPWDCKATWGVDNVWYPGCGAYGYCRFAVMDDFPVRHLDTRTFESTMQTNLAELRAYTKPFDALCESLESPTRDLATIALPLRTFCRWWNVRDALIAFDSVRVIDNDDAVNITMCPDTVDFPNVSNVPWWHVR